MTTTEQSKTREELIAWCEDEAARLAPVTHDYPRSGPARLKAGDEQRAKLHAAIAAFLREDGHLVEFYEEQARRDAALIGKLLDALKDIASKQGDVAALRGIAARALKPEVML